MPTSCSHGLLYLQQKVVLQEFYCFLVSASSNVIVYSLQFTVTVYLPLEYIHIIDKMTYMNGYIGIGLGPSTQVDISKAIILQ